MGEHRLVGRLARRRDGGQQRALEPAPVLVAAFEVEIRRDAALTKHRGPAGSRVEPHVLQAMMRAHVKTRTCTLTQFRKLMLTVSLALTLVFEVGLMNTRWTRRGRSAVYNPVRAVGTGDLAQHPQCPRRAGRHEQEQQPHRSSLSRPTKGRAHCGCRVRFGVTSLWVGQRA